MKNLICLILSLCFFTLAQSQSGDLYIEYNLFTDEITYKKDGKVVDKPYIKATKNIIVKVVEFNPYTIKANLVVNESAYNQNSVAQNSNNYNNGMPANGMGNMLGGGGSFGGIAGLLGNLGMGAATGDAYGGLPGSRGQLDAEGQALKSAYEAALVKLKVAEKKVNKSAKKIELYQNVDASLSLAALDIVSLKNNTKIKPSRIKEMIEEEVRYAFAKNEDEQIDIDDLVRKDKKETDIKAAVAAYKKAVGEYKTLLPSWYQIAASAMNYENTSGNQQLAHIQQSTGKIVTNINNIANNYDEASLNQLAQGGSNGEVGILSNLRQVYEELQSSDFTYSFPPIQAKGDKVQIKLNFSCKSTTPPTNNTNQYGGQYNNQYGGQQSGQYNNQYSGQYNGQGQYSSNTQTYPNQSYSQQNQQQPQQQHYQQYQQQQQNYGQSGNYEPYKTLEQTIPVSGTWKVTGGIGISFGALKDPRFEYTVRDNKIVGQELDQFIPIVTSFAHFYKQSPGNVNIGGSFGVGLPILGGSDIQAASFFLGPTVILGESSRFLLSGGLMGAKAKRLANGFQVGDSFDSFSEALPTINRYELGYFIGLSFSILK